MIEFRHKKIDARVYKIYMVYMDKSSPWVSIVPIPGKKGFCYTYSKEIARKTCKFLESVTGCQDLKYWNRQTLKQVQQIIRLLNRMNYRKHLYPIPFENLEKILGWELTAWAVTESYKQMISIFRYRFSCEAKFEAECKIEKRKIEKYILYQFLRWVEDVNQLGDLVSQGIVEPNLKPNLLDLED
ncbi:hypothetical protein [Coleofasciculus sp. G2-EDA-02]|uniref:hypothetical protein n=1 Tax=Coleofasciculus sp. G2-EDA-02 TaxID=3069529 RepID=UPI0032F4E4F2